MNPIYNSDDQAIIRSSVQVQWVALFDPLDVVFQAQVASVPTGSSYLEIAYNSVSIGVYTDIRVGQKLVISATADYTQPLVTRPMRIDASATASVLPINEEYLPLQVGYYLTVINTYEPMQMVRDGALVSGRLPFQGECGTIKGLPSVILVRSSGSGQYSFITAVQAPTGATVSSTSYEIPGATYDSGSASSLTPTITMPADSHTWGRFSYTLSNGVTRWMAFQIIVINPRSTSLVTQGIDSGRITRTWRGHHAILRARKGVAMSQVMDGTRTVLAAFRRYTSGAIDADPVLFVGYLTKEAGSTTSPTDKFVTFDVSSIWERAAQIQMNPIAIRDIATPSAWDEINLPTAQKVVRHVLSRYSTILNLCSLDLDDPDGSTWYGGEMNFSVASLGDAIEQVTSEINAVILQRPSGELVFRRDLRFEDETHRNAASVIWTLISRDLIELDLQASHTQQVGRIIMGYRGYQTSRAPSKGGKALAPIVTLGASPETQTRPNQLMPANLSDSSLLIEAAQRAGHILAYEDPPYSLTARVRSMAWLTPAAAEWLALDLLPSLTTRGRVLSGRALIGAVEITYDSGGIEVTSLELYPETKGGSALIVAMLTPNAASLTGVVTPPLAAYGGSYRTPSSLNLPNINKRRPFSRNDMGGMAPPMPADQAANEGRRNGQGGTRTFAISLANPADVAAGFTSVNSETYKITVSGSGKIQNDTTGSTTCVDLTASDGSWYASNNLGTPTSGFGSWVSGQGLAPNGTAFFFTHTAGTTSETINSATFTFNAPVTTFTLRKLGGTVYAYSGDPVSTVTFDATSYPALFPINLNTTAICISFPANIAPSSAFRVEEWCYSTDIPTDELYADAFYSWNLDEEGEPTNISYLGTSRGFQINSAAIAVPPPYNPSHVYTFEWTGDGNNPQVVFADDTYTDNQNQLLYVTFEGPGAGT